MDFEDLPVDLMHIEISQPRRDLFEKLESMQVIIYLEKTYKGTRDIADALDCAFTAMHIDAHMPDEEMALTEILGWYQDFHKKLSSPFYDLLKTTLNVLGHTQIYSKAIDHIIENKGQF